MLATSSVLVRYNASVENVALTSVFDWRGPDGAVASKQEAVFYDQHFRVSLDCGARFSLTLGVFSCVWALLSPCCNGMLKSNYSYHGAAPQRLRLMYCRACMRPVPYLQKNEARALANEEVQAWLVQALAHHTDPLTPPVLAWDLQDLAKRLHADWVRVFWERDDDSKVFREAEELHEELAAQYSVRFSL